MEAAIREIPDRLFGRVHGPLSVQLVRQPLVAASPANLVGLKDAREGRSAFGWTVATNPTQRHKLLRESWQDVSKVFVAAVIICEIFVFRRTYPDETLSVAIVLALFPYLLMRSSVNRIAQRWRRVHK